MQLLQREVTLADTSSASFSPEAVAKASQLDGQLLFTQDLVHVHGTQRHFSCTC